MENKINVAELLKDCPKGMELDCTMFDKAFFERITSAIDFPIEIRIDNTYIIHLTKEGFWNNNVFAKCVIFPKGKTTWEGFQKPFKDGDIVYFITENDNEYITIFKNDGNVYLETHIDVAVSTSRCSLGSSFYIDNIKEQRLATEKEKAQLFQAIKDNDYEWNNKTKSLTKLKKLKEVKDGDILISKLGSIFIVKNPDNYKYYYGCYIALDYLSKIVTNSTQLCNKKGCRFATGSEKQKLFDAMAENNYCWNARAKTLTDLVKPNFKVGNRVKSKINHYEYIIIDITKDSYIMNHSSGKHGYNVPFSSQNNFELVSEIDISTFKPFDKVLVRDNNDCFWRADFYSHLDYGTDYHYICTGDGYKQCIPYNEETADLVGTTNDCPDKYKIWKDK